MFYINSVNFVFTLSVCLKVLPLKRGLLFSRLLFHNVCFIFEPTVAVSNIPNNVFFCYCRFFNFNTAFTDARPGITSRTSWMLYIHNVLKSYSNIIILFAV